MGIEASNCVCKGCGKLATDGAHVKKIGEGDDKWYIVPLCHEHNMTTKIIEVEEVVLMPANRSVLDKSFENLV